MTRLPSPRRMTDRETKAHREAKRQIDAIYATDADLFRAVKRLQRETMLTGYAIELHDGSTVKIKISRTAARKRARKGTKR